MTTEFSRRGFLAAAGAVGASLVLAGCRPTTPLPQPLPMTAGLRPRPIMHPYATGASCIGVADGEFGDWRSRPVDVVCTWGHVGEARTLQPGAEYGDWTGNLDFAPQYRVDDDWDWTACASGAYDEVLSTHLSVLRGQWEGREGTLYLRFQHEFNGDWYPWSVGSEAGIPIYLAGWRRFAALFDRAFEGDPRFQLVWSPSTGLPSEVYKDIRDLYPGNDYVDVIGLDHYDFFDCSTQAQWNRNVDRFDEGGGPVGIGAWLDFAGEHGKPISVPEWGNQYGDNPVYIENMLELFADHAYSGAGDASGTVVYEAYFNQVLDDGTPSSDGDFRVQIGGRDHPGRPEAAAAYREFWS